MVRAAKPVACTLLGKIENRLSDEGVLSSLPNALPGDLVEPVTVGVIWSGELDVARDWSRPSLGGGNRDLNLASLVLSIVELSLDTLSGWTPGGLPFANSAPNLAES